MQPSGNGGGPGFEKADVVVVGARIAGCATAIPLARAGRRVIALDRARFPSNTISTHGLFPGHVAELARLGALERALAYGPPKLYWLLAYHRGWHVRERGRPVDGIDYGLSLARTQLDTAMVATARDAGADVRERSFVTDLVWDGDRVAGVRYRTVGERDVTREIRAPLVVGADGRQSTVAELVGAGVPYRGSKNGRGFAYWYMEDPRTGTDWRHTVTLWMVGLTHVMVVPMPDDLMCVIHMGPAEGIQAYRKEAGERWEQVLREHRHLAARVAGARRASNVFMAPDLPSFFRASSGPGWALAGDAGHFKDPVIGQGIRDSLQFGRRLGEVAAESLDDPADLDRRLCEWERERDRSVLPTYHWANKQTRVDMVDQPLLVEALRTFRRSEFELSDVFSRLRRPDEVISRGRGMLWAARAMSRPGADRRAILRAVAGEARIDADAQAERGFDRFRPARAAASEHPGWAWPPAAAARRAEARGATQPERRRPEPATA